MFLKPFKFSFLYILLFSINLHADQSGEPGQDVHNKQTVTHPAPGSDAQFDKRLPPVLPGEEVRDGKKVMKVWSTSGPVSVGNAPEPPQAPDPWRENIGSVGVIVDQRPPSDRVDKKR